MKKLYLDSNVVLDYLLDRQPASVVAEKLMQAAEQKQVVLLVSSLTYTIAHYVTSKTVGKAAALQALAGLFQLVKTVMVDENIIGQAIQSGLPDFEDAVQLFAALAAGADAIVTRDRKGFPTEQIAVLSPVAALELL